MGKHYLIILFLISCLTVHATGSFRLIHNDTGASICYDGNQIVVETAINILIADSRLVCKNPFIRTDGINRRTVIVGIPDKEPRLRSIAEKCGVDVSALRGTWEAFRIVQTEYEGKSCLLVLGSDARGTAYGVLELSRSIGVSPWVWWADVVPPKKSEVTFTPDGKIHAPSVQYRGIFLNDEDWALMPWATRTFEPTPTPGAIGPKSYAKIFELLLRLRANTIWPAMHECTVPFYMVEGNRQAAARYGIVVGTSHCEPMMRTNTGEWDNNKYGAYNFLTNRENVLSYWNERLMEITDTENIYTMGMRGIHDGRMQGVKTIEDEARILQRVIESQRNLLGNSGKGALHTIPQVFIPYKEVLDAYDAGLNLPDDISLVWCDDNHGYIMRLSDAAEQKRSGGGGVYYHISYWGKPHDYLWLASTQPGLIYAEMKRAWDNNARRLWILNVGDIKPGEYLTEFFLDMAWDMEAVSGNTIYAHQQKWIEKTFGAKAADKIHTILKQYYLLAAQRKPEHMGWNKVEDWSDPVYKRGLQPLKDTEFSFTAFGDEAERRIRAYREIAELSAAVYEHEIPPHLKAAYFQLVHYPVVASGAMNRKILYAQKSRAYASQNPELAGYYADLATQAYREIAALDYTYNKDMLDGKWELMMDMKPRDLPVFQEPVLPDLPADLRGDIAIPAAPVLTPTAGTPLEGDRMIALNAAGYINPIRLEIIESLGHSGKAVRLPVAKKADPKQPHLAYKVTTVSRGDVRVKVGVVPQHSVHGETKRRYAVVIDKQKPLVVETHAVFLSDKWSENVLRNQSLTESLAYLDEAGEHTIRIYALDEELLIDQLMLDFDPERKHYLIPSR